MVVRNIKVYVNTTTNRRKTNLNFLREITKNNPFRSPLLEGVESE